MTTSPFLSFDDDFPPTVMLIEPQTRDAQTTRWTLPRPSDEAARWLKGLASVFALCGVLGFFSGAMIAKLNEALNWQPVSARPATQPQPAPAPAMGIGAVSPLEPFSLSWPEAVDIEAARPMAYRIVDSMHAIADASSAAAQARPANLATHAQDKPLETLLVILGTLGALGMAAVAALNNWFAWLR